MDVDITQQLAENDREIAAINVKIIEATAVFQTDLRARQAKDAELRAALTEAMAASNTKKFENDYIKFTYVEPTVRKGVDIDQLKFLYPEIYEEVQKETAVRGSVRITIKKQAA